MTSESSRPSMRAFLVRCVHMAANSVLIADNGMYRTSEESSVLNFCGPNAVTVASRASLKDEVTCKMIRCVCVCVYVCVCVRMCACLKEEVTCEMIRCEYVSVSVSV